MCIRDRRMPEEINRILTDKITDYYFVTEQSGIDNLIKEEVQKDKIFFVGNTMIDSLVEFTPYIKESDILEKFKIEPKKYALMTMHRPSNVDTQLGLGILVDIIKNIVSKIDLVFPIHPRTIERLKQFNLWNDISNIKGLVFSEPLDYFSFQKLILESKFVITDSGGIQEETTYLQIPCLTLRDNTERPSTVELGSNTLVSYSVEAVSRHIEKIMNNQYKDGVVPPLWDGKSTERILEILSKTI